MWVEMFLPGMEKLNNSSMCSIKFPGPMKFSLFFSPKFLACACLKNYGKSIEKGMENGTKTRKKNYILSNKDLFACSKCFHLN